MSRSPTAAPFAALFGVMALIWPGITLIVLVGIITFAWPGITTLVLGNSAR